MPPDRAPVVTPAGGPGVGKKQSARSAFQQVGQRGLVTRSNMGADRQDAPRRFFARHLAMSAVQPRVLPGFIKPCGSASRLKSIWVVSIAFIPPSSIVIAWGS